ncbi:hypothetical protein H8D85_00925 [bacterium]|nr:hypothetical protein [bacterium]
MPSTSSYTLKFAATYGLYPNSLITNTSFDSYLPNPIKVKAVIYEYNSWDAKTAYITLQESTFYSLPSSNTLQEIEYTFSNFNMNCKSFRVGFIYSSYNSLDESDFGLTSFTGIFLVNIDMVSLFTGTIIGGYGPFILTEDTQSADIAEKYISLDGVSSGDLVCFGDPVKGKPSIKKAKKEDMDGRPLMIVSSNYFFTLKDEYSKEPGYGSASIALKGRVPCNIIGPISINDPISLYDDGTGKKASPGEIIVGHAITEHRGTGTGQVLVFIK